MPDQINLQYTTIKSPLPAFIYEGIQDFSKSANAYKPQPIELLEKIARKHEQQNITLANLYLTAGIDEALQMLIRAYGQVTTVFTPTYTVYADAELFGMKLNRVHSVENGEYRVKPETFPDSSLIILANPNNPSGITEPEIIRELVEVNPQAIIIIDEAYGEFAPELSMIPHLAKYKNLVVLRSFSKDYAMAGNRVGYILAQPEVITKVKDMSQWANVSYLSAGAAYTALDHEDYFKKLREEIANSREDLRQFLQDKGFTVYPSKINALLLQFSDEAAGTKFFEYLTTSNITTSHGNGNSNIGLDKSFVRIAIGTPEQLEVLKQVVISYKFFKLKL